MRTAMVGHGEIHDAVAVNVAGIGKSFSVRLPDAVNDRRLARITRRAMVELAAQIDDAHCHGPPSHRCSKHYTDFCRREVAHFRCRAAHGFCRLRRRASSVNCATFFRFVLMARSNSGPRPWTAATSMTIAPPYLLSSHSSLATVVIFLGTEKSRRRSQALSSVAPAVRALRAAAQ